MPQEIRIQSILNKTKRRDPWFLDEYTINPYSGCSFHCLYCYIRGSTYGTWMEEKVSVKQNAVEVLEKQLRHRAKKEQYGFIVMSSATDPYLHFEKDYQLTRSLIEVIEHYRFPLHIITKSDLVLRDLDILRRIRDTALLPADLREKVSGLLLTFSFSTLDAQVADIFEPGAPAPERRLGALREVLQQGFHSGVSFMPLLPYISDTKEELHRAFSTFSALGIKYIFPATLTLFGHQPSDSKTLVFRALEKHYPHLLEKYQRLFAQGSELPAYYRTAFYHAMKRLCAEYGIKDRIV